MLTCLQVCLSRKDVTDFKSYGVSIKVRFRDGEDWCELARGRQSGGEMSVTTAVYMVIITSWPYFGVKLSCVCLMFAYRKKSNDL